VCYILHNEQIFFTISYVKKDLKQESFKSALPDCLSSLQAVHIAGRFAMDPTPERIPEATFLQKQYNKEMNGVEI